MQWDDIMAALTEHGAALRASGATRLYIYGSRARGDHRPNSDLDLFIDYDPRDVPNLFGLMDFERRLSDALGVPVSIATRKSLHPRMKDKIEKDSIRVF